MKNKTKSNIQPFIFDFIFLRTILMYHHQGVIT